MKALYELPAPAKLNLFLHVTGRRADGYHLLQSAFMLIDWCDVLHFELRPSSNISREDLTVQLPSDDLTTKAAHLLQQATGCQDGVHITINKQIPAQAGLGGGSSDAATTLIALNRLWGLNLSAKNLATLGLQLGADVPFFIQGQNAWVEGIGEQITPIALPPAHFLVLKGPSGLETQKIFSAPDLKRNTERATMAIFAANHYNFGKNDLQPVAQAVCPEISTSVHWLESQGLSARMTGSGSAVFAKIPHDFVPEVFPYGWTSKVCGNLTVHPLHEWTVRDNSLVGSF